MSFSSNDEHFCTPFALHNGANTNRGQIATTRLEPENEYGNVEYKLRLTNPTPERVERLVTQLKWRIREGQGEAIVFLGVKDDGFFVGLTSEEIKLSLQTLEQMSKKIGARMTVVNERIVDDERDNDLDLVFNNQTNAKGKIMRTRSTKDITRTDNCENMSENKSKKSNSQSKTKKQLIRKVLQVLVKRKTHDISEELRVAVLGPTESGKSSLLGVLSHGDHDNGRGSARLNLFRHRHEIRSGHTSSISQEIFGFDEHGQPLTYNTCVTTEEIIESSAKIVTLIDLAGHQRYLGTTLFGLGSHSPDIVLLVINAIAPITSMITDNITLALGMDKSLAIVINKIDLVDNEDQETCYNELTEALQAIHPEVTPTKVVGFNDGLIAGARLDTKSLPIFFTSCVTGAGLNSLYGFFSASQPKLKQCDLEHAVSQSSELQVDETFEVPGIGTVVSGLVVEGIIREGEEMLLGPDDMGDFLKVNIVSLQRHKIPCNFARAGQKCTMAIMARNITARRGMVMKEMDTNWSLNFSACLQFEAEIRFITNKKYKLGSGSQVSVYVGNVKQTCIVSSICQKPNTSLYLVNLKLTRRPEYIRDGTKLIIRHALTNGIGIVSRTFPMSANRRE